MLQTSVNIGRGLRIKNPVMVASGTFGYGIEYTDFIDISRLGGIFVKGTTLHARQGNPYPRMAETPSGMLNAVGLQNKGVDYFCQHIYPQIYPYDTAMIVNVSGSQVEDYVATAEKINALEHIPAIELNISCPNVKEGGMAFGVTCAGAASVVRAVRAVYDKTLIVKLSPNVTDITEIARAVEAEGADSLSMINTLLGMAIDAECRRPVLWAIWPCSQAHCATDGLAGGSGGAYPYHRDGRDRFGGRCDRVPPRRGDGYRDRHVQLRGSYSLDTDPRGDRGLPATSWFL